MERSLLSIVPAPSAIGSTYTITDRETLILWKTGAEHGGEQHAIGRAERARKVRLEHLAARGRRPGLEDRPDAMVRIRGADTRERFRDRRWMVREVVVHRHAPRGAAELHAPADAFEPPEGLRHGVRAETDCRAHRDRPERVPHVECAEQRDLKRSRRLSAPPDAEPREPRLDLHVVRLPVGAVGQTKRFHATARNGP